MPSRSRILVVQPPSPPGMNVSREYAGGYGTAPRSARARYGHDRVPVIPYVSLLYLAALLERAGHEVGFLDGQAEDLAADAFCQRVVTFAPDALVSVVSLPSLQGDLSLLAQVREALPTCRTIAVGTTCRGLPEELLSDGAVDVAVVGDPEAVVPDLIDGIRDGGPTWAPAGAALARGGEIAFGPSAPPLVSLDSLPLPAYHLAPMSRYWHHHFGGEVRCAHVMASRGCPHRCRYYCPYPFGFGRRTLFRPVEAIVEELALLQRRYEVGAVLFADQSFTSSASRAASLCEEILRAGLRLRWLCQARLDEATPDLLSLMRAAGCERVHYGLETGDQTLLETIGKPGVDLDMAARAIAQTKAAGLTVHTHVVVGLPGETGRTVRQTLRALRQARPDSAQFVVLTPYPGTQFREDVLAAGRLRYPCDWSRYTGIDAVVDGEHMSAEGLARARDWLNANWARESVVRRGFRRAKRIVCGARSGERV